ncbi:hypothetical protein [Marinimicrobium alkaliphilum]|uniref:hypothetical protein n=1 Tax=Marinimicrobium alkaliphilum TaxID=2202654 RepID=UPI000DBAD847|nr:hypothetical protein [Marinimicrobium alkaliphilum]
MNKTDEQLNLWANGRLSEAERLAFEQQMAQDPALAREAKFAMALRQQLQDEPATPPGELGLARLQRAIRAGRQAPPNVQLRKNIWKPVAIAACLMVAIQTGLLLGPEPWRQNNAIDVRPASGEAATAGPRLQIVFEPTASTADIQASLRSVNGSIVAGPSALGIFQVQLPKDSAADEAAARLREFAFVDEVIAP